MQIPKKNRALRWTAIFAGVIVFAGTFFLASYFRAPPPEIPAPKNLAQLEPQLSEYISKQIKWVAEKPRAAERHALLGLIYGVNGLWPEARQAFQNAAVLEKSEPLPEMYVGVAAQEMGELDEASKVFQRINERFPKFAPGFYRLGYVLLRQGKLDEAERAFERLTVLDPQEWRGYASLGEIKIRKGQHKDAIPLLEKSLQLQPDAKTTHHLLGQAYQSIGRREDAEIELQLGRNAADSPMPDAWTKIGPQHVKVLQEQIQLANDLAESGEPAKAVELLGRALAYHPDNLNLVNQLAIALNRADQPQQASVLLKRALQKNSDYVPVLVTLSLCQQNLGDHASALGSAERAIALAPNVTQGYIAKANALLGMERDQDALMALESAARLDPQNAEIPMEKGDVLWRNLDRPSDARAQYEAALKLDPVFVPAWVRLADLSLHLSEIDRARECISRLRRLAPRLPELAVLEQKLQKHERR